MKVTIEFDETDCTKCPYFGRLPHLGDNVCNFPDKNGNPGQRNMGWESKPNKHFCGLLKMIIAEQKNVDGDGI